MLSKQVIVVRKESDLPMSKGKMAAQVAHASLGSLFEALSGQEKGYMSYSDKDFDINCRVSKDTPLHHWLTKSFTKVVLEADGEDIQKLYEAARVAQLPSAKIVDEGRTEFDQPEFTCIAIGPADPEKINEITGHLKLFKDPNSKYYKNRK